MIQITQTDKKAIEQKKHELIKQYKNLLLTYEESRQLYENILSTSSTPVLLCSKVEADNYSWTVTHWALYTLDGTKVYESGNHAVRDIWDKTLSDLNLSIGTQLKLKALVDAGDDSTANVILQYEPTSNVTGYFLLQGNAFRTTVSYEGTTQPDWL